METALLALVFACSLAVSGCAVLAFSASIEGVLLRLLSGELAAAWSRYAKFALFVASFTGGLRLGELESLGAWGAQAGATPVTAQKCLLEVFKTVAGVLTAASWMLFLFFAAALAASLVLEAYASFKSADKPPRPTERHGQAPAGRY